MLRRNTLESQHFIIAGEQKCGTTSLYKYLAQHPAIHCGTIHELNYFLPHQWDWHNRNRFKTWRRKQLFRLCRFSPLRQRVRDRYFRAMQKREGYISGDHSPTYFSFPGTPKILRQYVPEARLFIMLRNPVDRLYSHFWMTKRQGSHSYSTFDDFIENGGAYRQFNKYVENMMIWLRHYDRGSMCIINSDEFFRNPQLTLDHAFTFLKIRPFTVRDLTPEVPVSKKIGDYPPVARDLYLRLRDHYRDQQDGLLELTGVEFNWFD